MRADTPLTGTRVGYNIVIVTLDSHAAGPAARISPRLAKDFPGLTVSVHAAAEWAENPAALARATHIAPAGPPATAFARAVDLIFAPFLAPAAA